MASRTLRDKRAIETGNKATRDLVQSIKEKFVTRDRSIPTEDFWRRQLLYFAFTQVYPDSVGVSKDDVSRKIDQKLHSLKMRHQEIDHAQSDEVYVECLIRSHFDESRGLRLLHLESKNMKRIGTRTSLNSSTKILANDSTECLTNHARLLERSRRQNIPTATCLRSGDKWNRVQHIVPAIKELRKKYNNVPDIMRMKMHRLLFSEISYAINDQNPAVIDIFVAVLCEINMNVIEKIDIRSIKEILGMSKSPSITDFGKYAANELAVTCPMCMEEFPRTQIDTMFYCSCKSCMGCMKKYYENAINSINSLESLEKLTCYQETHKITDESRVLFFSFLNTKLNMCFPDNRKFVTNYMDKVFHVAHDKTVKKCGSPKCTNYFSTDNNQAIDCVQCTACEFYQCRQCCQKWYKEHKNMTCDQYTAWLFENDPEDPDVQAMKYINQHGFQCPNSDCLEFYEIKKGGCEDFKCKKCSTQFCRTCSALFLKNAEGQRCTQPNCILTDTLHAHCPPNCLRETRDCDIQDIFNHLQRNNINVNEELNKKHLSSDGNCTIEKCDKVVSQLSGGRLCETCYKEFLCILVWKRHLEPWELYADNNLTVMLRRASVRIPNNANRAILIEMCQRHLNKTLGKPKEIRRRHV